MAVYNELGLAPTLNKYGIMTKFNMGITRAFLNDIEGKDVLEIGPAYGRNVSTILNKCKSYTVIDLDSGHLGAINNQTDDYNVNKLTMIHGKFPNVYLNDNSYDIILIERVLHFFTPDEIDNVFEKLYNILRINGVCYILTAQSSGKLIVGTCLYNIQNYLGYEYPGYINLKLLRYLFHDRWIHNIIVYLFEKSEDRRNNQLKILGRMPDTIFFMNEHELYEMLIKHKFYIMSIGREHYSLPNETELFNTWDTIAIAVKQ